MRCPGCHAEISALRDICPHCGASTDSVFAEPPRSPQRPPQRSPEQLARNRKTVLTIGAGLLILGVAAGQIHPFGRHVSFHPGVMRIHSGDDRRDAREPVTIGAAELFEAYHSDSDAADDRFGDRPMIVTGEFLRTVPDGFGSIDMRLKTNHPDLPLGIDLDSHSVDAATKLEPGQMVTVSCREVAGTGDDPWVRDCVLQPPAPAEAAPAASAPPAGGSAPARHSARD